MRKIRAQIVFIAAAFLTLRGAAAADFLFPRATVTASREFTVLSPQKATLLDIGPSAQAVIFDSALGSCHLKAPEVAQSLTRLLSDAGPVSQVLKNLFSSPASNLRAVRLTVTVDDFGDNIKTFRSFYLPGEPAVGEAIIGIDCSNISRAYWLASLSHELVHAFLRGQNYPSWFEEGLAQLVESEAGGIQPAYSAKLLSLAAQAPSLFENRRPLPSSESYGIAYLFARYLMNAWGGWDSMRAIVESGPLTGSLDEIATRVRRHLDAQNWNPDLTSHLTGTQLFEFFAVALTLNDAHYPVYAVPQWVGFATPPLASWPEKLELGPGQFARVAGTNPPIGLDPNLTVYGVQSQGATFKILPAAQWASGAPDFYLVMNARLP